MKIRLAVLALFFALLFSSTATAMTVGKYTSGGWGDPAQSGHGYSIEVINSSLAIIFWYVYNPDGTSTFLVTVGNINGNIISGNTNYYSGMQFGVFDPSTLNEEHWGQVTVSFHDCNNATLNYASTMSHEGVPFGSGTVQLKKLVEIDQMQCADNPLAGLYQGSFYSDVLGTGIPGVAVLAPNGDFAAVSFDGIAGFGTYEVTGGAFNASGSAISMDSGFYYKAPLSFAGQMRADYRIVTDYSVPSRDSGYADLFATPSLYRRGALLSDIAGSYIGINLITGLQGAATVSVTGQVSGSDSSGCAYQGNVQVNDPRFNLLTVNLMVSNCGPSNGLYTGYGMVDDYQALGDRDSLLLLSTNGDYAGVYQLVR